MEFDRSLRKKEDNSEKFQEIEDLNFRKSHILDGNLFEIDSIHDMKALKESMTKKNLEKRNILHVPT